MTNSDSESRSAVEELVVECLGRFEDEGPGALERLCSEHPEHAERLRRRVDALSAFGMLPAPAEDALPSFDRLGDFELEEPLGDGGMGIVYRARQRSLGRTVAVKIVRPAELYFPGARERFQREVETIARLHHPGIVPIHAVGEENGVPYFAMELVDGATLGQVVEVLATYGLPESRKGPRGRTGRDLERAIARITGRPFDGTSPFFAGTWIDVVLRIVRDVAEALEHAHRRGVLHRDVKPSNVMVTGAGRVLLLDFGLAQTEGTQRVTRTGVPLGSLPYMAPEQLAAGRAPLDARSDVYSLGVTLFELLTLELPYRGDSATAIVESVLAARHPRLRSRNPDASIDVQTVVETAFDRDPERRYASAADLAADLANLLAHRPIHARRASPAQRLLLWARRRPAAALASALAVLVLVGGPALFGWQERRRSVAVASKNRELELALASLGIEKARAEHHFEQAFDAVSEVLRLTMARELRDVPRLQGARLAVIDRALAVARDLEEDRPDDVAVAIERARIERLRGDVLGSMKRPDEALEAYRNHLAVYERLLVRDPDDPFYVWEHAGCLHQIAVTESDRFAWDAADRAIERSLAGMRRAVALEPENRRSRSDLAQTLVTQAGGLRRAGRLAEAWRSADEALALRDALYAASPDDPHAARELGQVWLEVYSLEMVAGRYEGATASIGRALELFGEAHRADPADLWFEAACYDAETYAGNAWKMRGRDAEARAAFERAVAGFRTVVERYPAVTLYQERLGTALGQLAILHWENGRTDDALAVVHEASAIAAGAVRDRPDDPEILMLAGTVWSNEANFTLLAGRDPERAAELCEQALGALEACIRRGSLGPDLPDRIENARYNRALALCMGDRIDEAIAAIVAFEELEHDAEGHRLSGDLWNEWVLALRRVEPDAAARQDREGDGLARMFAGLERAVRNGYDDWAELDTTPALDPFRETVAFDELRRLRPVE